MPHPEIISRAEAQSQGLNRYFTGKPCKRGHLSERKSSNSRCLLCHNEDQRREYHSDPSNRDRSRNWRRANREQCSRQEKRSRQANPEHYAEYYRNWREENPELCLEYRSRWREENPEKCRAYAAKYRAAKLQAIPPWADLEAIAEIYAKCPEGHHVDHIHPLQGKFISGLHVENNLQYLTAEENLSKSNSFTQ